MIQTLTTSAYDQDKFDMKKGKKDRKKLDSSNLNIQDRQSREKPLLDLKLET